MNRHLPAAILLGLAPLNVGAQELTDERVIEKWKTGGVLELNLENTLVDKVFLIVDDKFSPMHVMPLSREEYERTGMNFKICGGELTYIDSPSLLEDPDFPCDGSKPDDPFAYKPKNWLGVKNIKIYDQNFQVIGSFTTKKVDGASLLVEAVLDPTIRQASDTSLVEFARVLKSGVGVVASSDKNGPYLAIQKPIEEILGPETFR